MTDAPKFDAELAADDVTYSWDRSFIGFISEPELGKLARHIESVLRDAFQAGEETMREKCAMQFTYRAQMVTLLPRADMEVVRQMEMFADLVRAIPTEPQEP